MKKRITVQGWILKPSRNVTIRDLLVMSRTIGGRVQLRYNLQRREFVAFTTAGDAVQQRLGALLSAFPSQKVNV